VQRSARNWLEPDSFRPERWLAHGEAGVPDEAEDVADAAEAARTAGRVCSGGSATPASSSSSGHTRPFLPFSAGLRSCVGQSLALVELKAFLALAVGRLTFRWPRVLDAARPLVCL
jgi:cytochrome P450